jgi:xanthine/uracil permease
MSTRGGRTTLIVIGAIVLIIGAVFAGQGANLLPGSSMTGDPKWLYIGLAMAVVGIILIVLGIRRGGVNPRA